MTWTLNKLGDWSIFPLVSELSLVFQRDILLYGADLPQLFLFDRTSELLIIGCYKECQDYVHKTKKTCYNRKHCSQNDNIKL